MKYITVKKFCETSGYTERAVYLKTQQGVWIEGQQYRKAPDGRLMIDVEGVEQWVEGQQALSSRGRTRSASSSRSMANVA